MPSSTRTDLVVWSLWRTRLFSGRVGTIACVGDGLRRAVDVTVSAGALAAAGVPMALIAFAIRLTTGSPVLFWQLRSGWRGQEFHIAKFRTMRSQAYAGEPDAERVTKVGRLLRNRSLDELPQLWNVLRGEMSLIGPRPTLPEQVAHYSPRQLGRLEVRPGITGYAQVLGRNAISWPERIELDLYYIDHRSLALDAWILWRTAVKLVRREGITGEGGVNPGFPIARDA